MSGSADRGACWGCFSAVEVQRIGLLSGLVIKRRSVKVGRNVNQQCVICDRYRYWCGRRLNPGSMVKVKRPMFLTGTYRVPFITHSKAVSP